LSYHRAGESGSKSGPPTMTVCTNHVALGDLVEDRPPFAVADAFSDVEVLGLDVIELEDQGVGLAAVDAGVLAEELDEVCGSFGDEGLLVTEGFRDVALFVRDVVFPFIGGAAGAAVGVSLPARLAAPGEVSRREELAAAVAGPCCTGRCGGLSWRSAR
jgi:hypothetical protein